MKFALRREHSLLPEGFVVHKRITLVGDRLSSDTFLVNDDDALGGNNEGIASTFEGRFDAFVGL